jgi:lipid II isoglutaminyl synthase (glutamine-hydrolysing)
VDPTLSAAVVAGKLTSTTIRRLGRGGGTTLPGRVSARIDGRALEKLSRGLELGVIVVAGTNGKTTTSSLLRTILEASGARVVGNRAGANLVSGLTAAVVADSRLGGSARAQVGVFEVDEASLPAVVAATLPRVVVVTNLFRDQLDRYGELESSAAAISAGLAALPAASQVMLCADDPAVAYLGRDLRAEVKYFGLDDGAQGQPQLPHAADSKFCPRCGQPFDFSRVYVGHLGHYRCPTGDFERPMADLSATRAEFSGLVSQAITVTGMGTTAELLEVPLSGLYNTYNILAATAGALCAGIPAGTVKAALRDFQPAFGRLERVDVDGRILHLLLAKNPAGFNEVLRASRTLGQGRRFVIAVNDRIADGRDISWIWDVDFELLDDAERIVLTGDRALDMRIRLKYGGVPMNRVEVVPTVAGGVDAALHLAADGEEVFILPTYTAMLELRAEMARRGYLRPFWEG